MSSPSKRERPRRSLPVEETRRTGSGELIAGGVAGAEDAAMVVAMAAGPTGTPKKVQSPGQRRRLQKNRQLRSGLPFAITTEITTEIAIEVKVAVRNVGRSAADPTAQAVGQNRAPDAGLTPAARAKAERHMPGRLRDISRWYYPASRSRSTSVSRSRLLRRPRSRRRTCPPTLTVIPAHHSTPHFLRMSR